MAGVPVIYQHHFTSDLGCGWFRLFGLGLAWVDSSRYGELLARRYVGKHGWQDRHQLRVGNWRFALTTWRHP